MSLQDRSFVGSGANQHLAFGALVGTDLAVFDLPADVELHSERPVEVVIGPAEADDLSMIERFPPWHIEVASLDSSINSRVCIVRLRHRSEHATRVTTLDQDGLREALTATGDISLALRDQGVQLPEPNDPRLSEAMVRILQIEAQQAGRVLRIVRGRVPDDIIRCVFSPKCQPEPPQRSRPRPWLNADRDDTPDR